jgi:hypothetical protein
MMSYSTSSSRTSHTNLIFKLSNLNVVLKVLNKIITKALATLAEHKTTTTMSVGNNGAIKSMNVAMSFKASAKSLHFLQSKSNDVPLAHENKICPM